jgi:hypothetical protein
VPPLTLERKLVVLVSMLAIDGVVAVSFVLDARRPAGSEPVISVLLGAGVVVLFVWTLLLGRGLWTDVPWARVAVIATFALIAAGGVFAAVDVVLRIRSDRVPFGAPPFHLVAPAVVTVLAGTIVVFVSPSRRQDP